MTVLEMIQEWERGCSCAGPMYDEIMGNQEGTTPAWECQECTEGLISAIKDTVQHEVSA